MYTKNELIHYVNRCKIHLEAKSAEIKNPTFQQKLYIKYYFKVINELKEIFEDADENLIPELDKFLIKNWQLINGNYLGYTSIRSELTGLLCDIACFIEENDKSSTKRCALQILMPTVRIVSYSDKYKDLDTLDLDEILENYILSREGKYLIPVEQLLEYKGKNKKVNNYYYSYEDPADYTCLTDEEYQRLIDHSSYSKAVIEAKNLYESTKKAQGSLLSQLENLIQQLYFNSVGGKGTELKAGEAVYKVIFYFIDYYKQLDSKLIEKIPEDVKNAIDELLAFVSDIKKNLTDTGEVNTGTCINTIRNNLDYFVKKESCVLETLGLSQEKMTTILEEQRKGWKEAENDFLVATMYKLEGFDNLPITVQLIEALEIEITITDEEDLDDLIQAIPASELEILFTKRADLRQQIIDLWDDVEDLRAYIAQIPHDKSKVLLSSCRDELQEKFITNEPIINQQIAFLLEVSDSEIIPTLCNTFLTENFWTLRIVFKKIPEERLLLIIDAIKDSLPQVIGNPTKFGIIMQLFKIDSPEHTVIFNLMKASVAGKIQEFSELNAVLSPLSFEQREIILEQIKGKLPKLIDKPMNFKLLFMYLSEKGKEIALNEMLEHLPKLINNNNYNLIHVIGSVSDKQMALVLQKINLSPFLTTANLKKIYGRLTPNQVLLFREALKAQGLQEENTQGTSIKRPFFSKTQSQCHNTKSEESLKENPINK